MSGDAEFKKLEGLVESLVAKFGELKAEKKALVRELEKKNSLISELEEKISTRDGERDEISERVGRIVARIESWEDSLEDNDGSEVEAGAAEADSAAEADEPQRENSGSAKGEEGRIQHNLFSMPG